MKHVLDLLPKIQPGSFSLIDICGVAVIPFLGNCEEVGEFQFRILSPPNCCKCKSGKLIPFLMPHHCSIAASSQTKECSQCQSCHKFDCHADRGVQAPVAETAIEDLFVRLQSRVLQDFRDYEDTQLQSYFVEATQFFKESLEDRQHFWEKNNYHSNLRNCGYRCWIHTLIRSIARAIPETWFLTFNIDDFQSLDNINKTIISFCVSSRYRRGGREALGDFPTTMLAATSVSGN